MAHEADLRERPAPGLPDDVQAADLGSVVAMNVTCPGCGSEFHAKHPHLTEEGFVAVRLHKQRKRTLYVRREDIDQDIIDRIERLEHENTLLRRKLSAAKGEHLPVGIGTVHVVTEGNPWSGGTSRRNITNDVEGYFASRDDKEAGSDG